MRETRLLRADQELLVRTDDRGTQLRDGGGTILAEYGTDQHERLVDAYAGQGWQPQAEHRIRPAVAGPPRQPSGGPQGRGVTDGEDA